MAMFYQDAVGAQQWKKAIPLFGNGTNIKVGAFVRWGDVEATNQAFGILAEANTDLDALFIGVTESAFAAATLDNDPSAGTKYLLTDCTINPYGMYLTQYDNALTGSRFTNGLTLSAVTIATPSVTVTSGEAMGGGWLFFDNGELRYVLSTSAGVYTLKSATSSAVTTANKVAKIYWKGKNLITLTTDATQIGIATAAAGVVQFNVEDNFIKAVGFDYVPLDPTKHDGLILPITPIFPAIYGLLQSYQHYMIA